jgi:hypothetical protein
MAMPQKSSSILTSLNMPCGTPGFHLRIETHQLFRINLPFDRDRPLARRCQAEVMPDITRLIVKVRNDGAIRGLRQANRAIGPGGGRSAYWLVILLSQTITVSSSHLTLAWNSVARSMNVYRNPSSASLSSSLSPTMCFVKALFMNSAFSPVAGWTRTTGWTVSIGRLLRIPRGEPSACSRPECTATKVSK